MILAKGENSISSGDGGRGAVEYM